jgi:hypothetical protein
VSIKKLERWEGLWHYRKEVLGFELDGGDCTIGILTTKAMAYQEVIMMALSKSKIALQKLWKIQGKLQHVGLIAPSIRGFMTPINCAMVCCENRGHIGLGHKSVFR